MQQRFRTESGRLGTYYATDSIPATGATTAAIAAIPNGAAATASTTVSNANTTDQRNAFEQAAIGLNTKDFGALRMGRFTNILGFNAYNLMEDSGYGAGTSSQNGRLSAQVQYTSPSVAGFQYIYLNANKVSNKYGTLAGNGYGSGTLIGTTQSLVAHTIKYANGPIFAQFSTVDGLTGEASTHLGGTYDLGNGIKLAAGQFDQKDAFGTQLVHKNTSYGVEYKTGPWTTAVMMSSANAKMATAHTGKREQTGLKAYYALSKRTTILGTYSDIKRSGGASYTSGTNGSSTLGTTASTTTNSGAQYRVRLMHSF
jgi:predicted porin